MEASIFKIVNGLLDKLYAPLADGKLVPQEIEIQKLSDEMRTAVGKYGKPRTDILGESVLFPREVISTAVELLNDAYGGLGAGLKPDFADEFVRIAYVHRHMGPRAALVAECISPLLWPTWSLLDFSKPVRMVSFGAGPGTDLLGLVYQWHARLGRGPAEGASIPHIEYVAVDAFDGWFKVVRHLVDMLNESGLAKVDLDTIVCDMAAAQSDVSGLVSCLQAELVSLVYATSEASAGHSTDSPTWAFIDKVFRAVADESLVFFLDITDPKSEAVSPVDHVAGIAGVAGLAEVLPTNIKSDFHPDSKHKLQELAIYREVWGTPAMKHSAAYWVRSRKKRRPKPTPVSTDPSELLDPNV